MLINKVNIANSIEITIITDNEEITSEVFSIVVNPSFKFIRDYIFKAGFLDGYYGLIVCLNSAYATFLKYTLIYELQRSSKNTSSQ